MLERDQLKPAPDVESAAAAAFRPAAPQIVQPHIVMARCRELLLQRLPDVYGALLAAGVAEAPVATQMPASLADRTAWPGDERYLPTTRTPPRPPPRRYLPTTRSPTAPGGWRARRVLTVT